MKSPRIPLVCPCCGHVGQSPMSHLGRSVRCKSCRETFALRSHARTVCPGCLKTVRILPGLLDEKVTCNGCEATFVASQENAFAETRRALASSPSRRGRLGEATGRTSRRPDRLESLRAELAGALRLVRSLQKENACLREVLESGLPARTDAPLPEEYEDQLGGQIDYLAAELASLRALSAELAGSSASAGTLAALERSRLAEADSRRRAVREAERAERLATDLARLTALMHEFFEGRTEPEDGPDDPDALLPFAETEPVQAGCREFRSDLAAGPHPDCQDSPGAVTLH